MMIILTITERRAVLAARAAVGAVAGAKPVRTGLADPAGCAAVVIVIVIIIIIIMVIVIMVMVMVMVIVIVIVIVIVK